MTPQKRSLANVAELLDLDFQLRSGGVAFTLRISALTTLVFGICSGD